MAFATSQLTSGVRGNKRYVSGKWTGSAGDAAGTIVIGSSEVQSVEFDPRIGSSGPAERPLISTSASSGQTTVSVYYKQNVTDGRFTITY